VSIASVGAESLRELEALMHAPAIFLTRAQRAELDSASAETQRGFSMPKRK
jgi:hypothetical protein